jgi:DNA-binding NtrC family response regulator
MQQGDIGLLLTDERMPGISGIELLGQVHKRWPETVRIIVSAYTDPDRLFRAINQGTGTGKERIARLIHEQSRRSSGPLVPVNCGARDGWALEIELFGHEQGAFTGALSMRRGRFELARGGTILLKEIDDISLKLQMRLLRVLQGQRFERIGGSEPIPLDVRVVATARRNIEELVRRGAFQEDLFHWLNVTPIVVPPLRERPDDIGPLLDHFIVKYSRGRPRCASAEAREALARYAWPGNVRELENLVQRAVMLSDDDELQLEDFCITFGSHGPGGPDSGILEPVRETDAERLRELLMKHGGNIARAARELGIPRTTLVSRLTKQG